MDFQVQWFKSTFMNLNVTTYSKNETTFKLDSGGRAERNCGINTNFCCHISK